MADAVPAADFTRDFERYRKLAQREAVAVSSEGRIAGYFVRPDEYEDFQRFKHFRRSFATRELDAEKIAAVLSGRMDARHDHLDALMDDA